MKTYTCFVTWFCNTKVEIPIDIATFSFSAHTSEYDCTDPKSDAWVSFEVDKTIDANTYEIFNKVKADFCQNINPEYIDVDQYILLSSDFKRISIRLGTSDSGMANPSQFEFVVKEASYF